MEKDQELLEMLKRWSDLSEAQRTAFTALTSEVDIATGFMEAGVEKVSTGFQSLAGNASKLSNDMFTLLKDADKVEIQGEDVPFDQVVLGLRDAIMELLNKLTELSNFNDDVSQELKQISQAITNKATAAHGLDKTQKALEYLEDIEEGLNAQQTRVLDAITVSLQDSRAMAEDIGKLTTTLQFQDRTSQRMQHVKESLLVLSDMLQKNEAETEKYTIDVKGKLTKEELLSQLISGITLAEVKERFIQTVLNGEIIDQGISDQEHLDASDDIDLF